MWRCVDAVVMSRVRQLSLSSVTYCSKASDCRQMSTVPHPSTLPSTMSAWQLHEYGDINQLKLSSAVRMPVICHPHDVLVRVCAASVNPVDVMMVGGYGSATLNMLRQLYGTMHRESEFPLTLGRDFSGHIVDMGCGVDQNIYRIGDAVWGAGNAAYPGTHAKYTIVSSKEVSHKPKSLSHTEAASMPYVAATTWAAICTVSGFSPHNLAGRRVLMLGGSGGIGTFAIQLLKAWGAHVTTTCSSDAVDKVLKLGADIALDYTKHNVMHELQRLHRFDLIYDAVGEEEIADNAATLLRPFTGATYVSVVVPLLRNVDTNGVVFGLTKSACQLSTSVVKGLSNGINIRWGLFMPNGSAMKAVAKLVDEGKIQPQVESTFPFEQLPSAFEKVSIKHSRGKTVIDIAGLHEK